MSGSSFGTLFRVTTFGESHCKGVGAIVDGCPPGMRLTEADVQPQLTRRRPGQSRLTTPRSETDIVTILSGTERGITLGTPICLTVPNENTKPGDYAEMTAIPRPGHADYTYHIKYGVHASSGGGRSSARETIGRVAAGAIAEKWLREAYGTAVVTFVSSVGPVDLPPHALRRPDGSHWTRGDVDRMGSLGLLRDARHSGWRNVRAAGSSGAGAGFGSTAAASAAGAAAALTPAQKAEQTASDAADEALFVAAYRRRCPDEAGPYAADAEAAATATGSSSSASASASSPLASAGLAGGAYAPGTPCYEDADGTVYDMDGAVIAPRALLALADAAAAGSSAAAASSSGGSATEGTAAASAAATAGAAASSLSAAEAARIEAFLAPLRSDEMLCLRCPHASTACRMASQIRLVKAEDDSAGGVLTTVVTGSPMGLGEPVFDKAEALLAHAMLSLPATKGFEIGSGFAGTRLRGSQHNDAFVAAAPSPSPPAGAGGSTGAASGGGGAGSSSAASMPKVLLRPATNNAGGTLGGITSGAELIFRVPIKPVSTIGRAQATATYGGEEAVLEAKGRHDPCVLPRAPPLLEAMTALVLADLALIQRSRAPHGVLHVLPPFAATGSASAGAAQAGELLAESEGEASTAGVGRKRKHNEL